MKINLKKILPEKKGVWILIGSAMILSFLVGRAITSREAAPDLHNHESETARVQFWTCSMHPQIQQPKFGKCPICGMDLIPVTGEHESESAVPQLKLSDRAQKLASVAVTPVVRQNVVRQIRLVGKIEYDETRISEISAWFPGRIEKLWVNSTGIPVKKDQLVAEIYSPEILASQAELRQSVENLEKSREKNSPDAERLAEQQLNAARERLRLWGLSAAQIREMAAETILSEQVKIFSPENGFVIEKKVQEGIYVNTGSLLFRVADLKQVWLLLDAYESDLAGLRNGQSVQFTTEAFPAKIFAGRIAWIYPTLENQTRTVKVRVEVANPDLLLKPGMLARAEIFSEVAQSRNAAPLVIPASAPLITGNRAIVYLQVSQGVYEGREIVLGPRAGDYYVVVSGLSEGEKVVVKGNFKIDSAIQILAKPSMMSPKDQPKQPFVTREIESEKSFSPKKLPTDFRTTLDALYLDYFELQFALSHDQFDASREKAGKFLETLAKIPMKSLPKVAHTSWMPAANKLKKAAEKIQVAKEIEDARTAFEPLSSELIQVGQKFQSEKHRLLVFHCPMAFDYKGADWLQNKEGTENPYFGSQMFSCGEQTADLTRNEKRKNSGEVTNE